MIFFEVSLKKLSTIKYLSTLSDPVGTCFMASPCLDLIMLGIFVPLPIVLTSEDLRARRKSASIRPSMTFFMFPTVSLA